MAEVEMIKLDVFNPDAVGSETATFTRRLEKVIASMPPPQTRTPQELRDERESGKGYMGPIKRLDDAQDRVVACKGHDIPIRVYYPDQVNGVYMHMHGGGFVLSHPHHFDEFLDQTAKRSKVVVISVDYRLAPENPYPAAADDCETVAVWLVDKVKSEFGSEKLIIGGESAGANLSVVTLVRMRDRHDFTGFRGANLIYGCFNIAMTPSQRNWGEKNLIISTPMIEWFNNHYVPQIEKREDPDISPIYANLSNMPPALFTVGTLDPLLDDTLFMYARWLAAGNQARLDIYPGGTHVFNFFPTGIAQEANEKVFDFIAGIAEQ